MSTQPRSRLKFDSVLEHKDDGKMWAEVALTFNGETVAGRSPEVDEEGARSGIRPVALATLDAIGAFVGHRFSCDLQEVDRVHALGKELVVLLINMEFENRRIQLFGSCRVGDSVTEAAAKAALDATNRYVDIVLSTRDDAS
jgi:hypothetical protein